MLTIAEILQATGGQILNEKVNSRQKIKSISSDSRSIKKGDLFIALKGEKFDGHDYLNDVVKKGASVLIVSKKIRVPGNAIGILVKDTTRALGHLAGFYRRKFDIPVITITGSSGKTTTKEMIAHVLSTQYKVLKNIKTENNHIGVPQTLFRLDPSYGLVVLECGTNQPGDIEWLAEIANPTVAVFTNIGDSHLEKLKNRKGVFEEKFQMVKNISSEGSIIFNADDEYLSRIAPMKFAPRKIAYSIRTKSSYRAGNIQSMSTGQIGFAVGKDKFVLNAWAQHNVYNALAAIACADMFKIKKSNMKKALKTFVNCSGRQEIKKFNGLTVIDDTYNANPVSFKSAVDALSAMPVKGKKIVVCADMLELGKESKKLHSDLGAHISRSRIDKVLTYGVFARWISHSIKGKNIEATHYKDWDHFEKDLLRMCETNDAVLVKGSRGMRMEKAVEALRKNFSN